MQTFISSELTSSYSIGTSVISLVTTSHTSLCRRCAPCVRSVSRPSPPSSTTCAPSGTTNDTACRRRRRPSTRRTPTSSSPGTYPERGRCRSEVPVVDPVLFGMCQCVPDAGCLCPCADRMSVRYQDVFCRCADPVSVCASLFSHVSSLPLYSGGTSVAVLSPLCPPPPSVRTLSPL